MRLIVLGSGGWIPTDSRETASYLIDTGESLIIIDTGSGLRRLGEHIDILNKYQDINIIYSHYHLDHSAGLNYIGNWSREKNMNIYGPGKALGFNSCNEIINTLINPPFFPFGIDKFAKNVNIMDYDMNGFKIGNTEIKINPQTHSGGSFGITIGNFLHYASDTFIQESTFMAAEGVKLLLHECWTVMNGTSKDHSSYEQIDKMLNTHNIQKLGLIHINPNWKAENFKELYTSFNLGERIVVVEDGMVFEL